MRLSYFDNEKSGPVLLFIHGTASSNEVWEDQYKLLNDSNCRVIGVDLRGHGSSLNPGGVCTIDDHVNDLVETINNIGIKSPITIIGHSFGAVLAVRFAEIFPDSVYKLLLVSLPPRVPRILCLYYKWFLGKPIKFLKQRMKFLLRFNSRLLKRYKTAIGTDLNIVRQIWRESLYWDFLKSKPAINCPVHFSVGRFDYVSLKSMVKKVHRQLPNSSYKEFNWASHTCMDDQPNEFNRWILSSLALPSYSH